MATQSEDLQNKLASQFHQVLTFVVGTETYGVDLARVQEIRGWSAVTRLPETPPELVGVLNLRGSMVPVIDLRHRLLSEHAQYTATTVLIVISASTPRGPQPMGMVVDSVSDVTQIKGSDMKPMPDLGATAVLKYISGLAQIGGHMVVLLDVERLVCPTGSLTQDFQS